MTSVVLEVSRLIHLCVLVFFLHLCALLLSVKKHFEPCQPERCSKAMVREKV